MEKKFASLDKELTDNQRKILFILSLYSSEEELEFLQYTGWLTLAYFIMTKGLLPGYKEQLLVYDYKTDRRYLWEDKTYMDDVNILRQKKLVIRARSRSSEYRDINAHQCTTFGKQYLDFIELKESPDGKAILSYLTCQNCKNLLIPIFEDEQPVLQCLKHPKIRVIVEGFLWDLHEPILEELKPFFL